MNSRTSTPKGREEKNSDILTLEIQKKKGGRGEISTNRRKEWVYFRKEWKRKKDRE